MEQIEISGKDLEKLLTHLEDVVDGEDMSESVRIQPTYVEYGEDLDVALTSVVLSGILGAITSVLTDYFKKRVNASIENEVVLTRKNSKGDEIKITLKNRSSQEVEAQLKAFMSA